MIFKKLLLSSVVCAVVAISAATPTISQAATPPDMLIVATRIDDVTSLDPQESFEFAGSDVLNNVYDKLVNFAPDDLSAGYQPNLAESWTISEDGKTFTFKMREGVKFHSGNPVTAKDAEFSLRRAVLLEKSPSFIVKQFGFTAENVTQTIKAVDDSTLVMVTDKKYAPSFVLNCLTATIGGIVDSKLAMENETDGDFGNGWLKTNTAGSGAYSVKSWKPNDSVTLVANPDYYLGAPNMKRIIVRHIEESATERLLLERGDVDIARKLSPEDIAAVSQGADTKVEDDLRGRIMYFALNQKDPVLSKPKVREAVRWLVDYEGMANSFLKGQYAVHQSYLPKTYLGEIEDTPFSMDIEKAKALLAEAGHADGFDVEIIVRTAQERVEIAQSLQHTFAKAGINVSIKTGTGKQILSIYRAREHQIYLGAWGPDYPDPQTNAGTFAANGDNSDAASAGKTLAWRNSWDIPALTAQTVAAVEELDRDTRAKLYQDSQRKHQVDSPFVIMFQKIEQSALRSNVKNFRTGSAVSMVSYRQVTK